MTDPSDAAAWLARDDTSTVPVLGSCSIGRAPTNHLVLADDKVSRKHARIHRHGEHEYWLVDLGSRLLVQPAGRHPLSGFEGSFEFFGF